MSTKASISSGDKYHFYIQELLSEAPRSVFLNLEKPDSFEVSKESYKDQVIESVTVEIPTEAMDEIAVKWIKHRKLQGAVGGPVGMEWGSPDCPYD